MKMTKEILHKIEVGDGLTDEELDISVEFFTDLEEKLDLMGAKYYLAWKPVFYLKIRLQEFKNARKNRW